VRHKRLVIFSSSAWYEATGKKRPHSPAGDNSAHSDNVREPASKGAGTTLFWLVRHLTEYAEKRRKKERQELEEEQETDGKEIMKKSQSAMYPIPGRLLILIVPQPSMLITPSVSSSHLVTHPSVTFLPHLRLQEFCEIEHHEQGQEAAPKAKSS